MENGVYELVSNVFEVEHKRYLLKNEYGKRLFELRSGIFVSKLTKIGLNEYLLDAKEEKDRKMFCIGSDKLEIKDI